MPVSVGRLALGSNCSPALDRAITAALLEEDYTSRYFPDSRALVRILGEFGVGLVEQEGDRGRPCRFEGDNKVAQQFGLVGSDMSGNEGEIGLISIVSPVPSPEERERALGRVFSRFER